jgi:hypothetical protein
MATRQIGGSGRTHDVRAVREHAPQNARFPAARRVAEVPVDGVADDPLLRPHDYAA